MRRHYRARAAEPQTPPGPTLNACIAAACNEANARMRQGGRTEWDDDDYAVAVRVFRHFAHKLPPPYPEMADRIAATLPKPPL